MRNTLDTSGRVIALRQQAQLLRFGMALVVAVSCYAIGIPCAVAADAPQTIAVPASVEGTLASEGGGGAYDFRYYLPLTAGQTISVRCDVATGVPLPAGHFWAPRRFTIVEVPHFAPGTSTWRCSIMAPESGLYGLMLLSSEPATYTLSLETTSAAAYRFTSTRVRKAPKWYGRRVYLVASGISPTYQGFYTYDSPATPAYGVFRLMVERRRHGRWRPYSSAGADVAGPVGRDWVASEIKLPKGTFRVRMRLRDAAHPHNLYGQYKKIVVR
jgi:hypothetical protein